MKVHKLFTFDVRPGLLYKIPQAPDNVMLDLTWRCDRKCLFCYNSISERKKGNPPDKILISIIEKLAEFGVREILYLGGEPTLAPNFNDVIMRGFELGLAQRLVTHGGHITPTLAKKLAHMDVEVGVSIHSADPFIHDHLMGCPGAFKRAMMGIELLVNAGVRLWIQHSPTKLNVGHISALAELVKKRWHTSISYFDINRLLPFGEGERESSNLFLDEKMWWKLLCEASELVSLGFDVRIESVPRCWVRNRATQDNIAPGLTQAILKTLRPCYMAITQLAFDPMGKIKLCPGGPPIGPSIIDVDPQELWNFSHVLTSRRKLSFLPKKCVDYINQTICEEFYECGGGCRSANGNIWGLADPLGPKP